MKRSLSLSRELLAALTPDELSEVAGGALPTTPVRNCPYLENTYFYCITRGSSCEYC